MASLIEPSLAGLTGLARRLVTEGALSVEDVRSAVESAAQKKLSLVSWLLGRKLIDSMRLTELAAAEFGTPIIDVDALSPSALPLQLIDDALLTRHQVLPLFKRGKRLFIAIADPTQLNVLDDIKFHSNCMVEPVLVEPQQLKKAIETAIGISHATINQMADEGEEQHLDDSEINDNHVVQFVNRVLIDAIRRGASDIHFEPYERTYRVRFRTDGLLLPVANPPLNLSARLSARLKVMSGLDIAEKRVPQDGRLQLELPKGGAMDFRVSTLPTLFGEKIVLRLLDSSAARLSIELLGFEDEQKQLYLAAIHKPYGMVLVTGPTGSGKTVSLYTALNVLNTTERNISTVEDPVEIRLEGINQVQQNTKRGMTFAAALRSFLRQDPDVIMVGEIRDLETAEIAIKAAQTGHMVLSTLHTNDAPQTITRLMNMGVASYNITSSVSLVVAQRLARRLCAHCKRPSELPPQALLAAGFSAEEIAAGLKIFDAAGCTQCNSGYRGRVGIYQVMPMLEEIQHIILQGGNTLQIAEAAQRDGVRDLRQSALLKVKQGLTSLAEIDRVTKD